MRGTLRRRYGRLDGPRRRATRGWRGQRGIATSHSRRLCDAHLFVALCTGVLQYFSDTPFSCFISAARCLTARPLTLMRIKSGREQRTCKPRGDESQGGVRQRSPSLDPPTLRAKSKWTPIVCACASHLQVAGHHSGAGSPCLARAHVPILGSRPGAPSEPASRQRVTADSEDANRRTRAGPRSVPPVSVRVPSAHALIQPVASGVSEDTRKRIKSTTPATQEELARDAGLPTRVLHKAPLLQTKLRRTQSQPWKL